MSADRLCIYGPPEGELCQKLVGWLGESKGRVAYILSGQKNCSFSHDRVHFFEMGGLEEEAILRKMAWEGVFLKWEYLGAHPVIDKLKSIQKEVHLFASDFADRGVQVARNLMDNLSQMEEIYLASDLKDHFKDIPAIICGAGPSLERAAGSLKRVQDRALFFSGGAGLKALEHLGLRAHFSGAIDPYPAKRRLELKESLNLPVFFQSRVASDLLREMCGPKIWVEPSGHFPLESWFADSIGLPGGTFDGGWNVATFLAAIAVHLGCNPVVLVGVDLEGSYAGSVIENEGEKGDWRAAKKWLSEFMSCHPQVHYWPYELPSGEVNASIAAPPFRPLDREKCRLEFTESIGRVKDLCRQLIDKEDFLARFELEEECAYQVFFGPVWEVWQHPFQREFEDLRVAKLLFIQGICDEL